MNDLRIKATGIPINCILAVWLWRHPYQPIFDGVECWYVYHPVDKCFYYRNLRNKVRKDWYRANGMQNYLTMAMNHFPELCIPVVSV